MAGGMRAISGGGDFLRWRKTNIAIERGVEGLKRIYLLTKCNGGF
jgi:hypothetical protein